MRRLLAVLAVPLIAVTLIACGGDDDDSTATATEETSGSKGGSSAVFCKKAKAVDQEFSQLDDAFTGTGAPNGEVFQDAADALDKLAADAPKEIRSDMSTVADGVRKVADVLGDIDLSDPAVLRDPNNAAKLQQMSEEMQSLGEEIQASSERVAKYLEDECGIDMGDSTTSEVTTATTSG